MRDEEEVKEAFEAQAASADESRELCDIFGLLVCPDLLVVT